MLTIRSTVTVTGVILLQVGQVNVKQGWIGGTTHIQAAGCVHVSHFTLPLFFKLLSEKLVVLSYPAIHYPAM